MVSLLGRMGIILVALFHLAASCQGTETGNPGNAQAGNESPETYTNDTFGVEAEYVSGWGVTENEPSGGGEAVEDIPSGEPAPAMEGGIDTSGSPSTEFTDGTSTVILFYVTLDSQPSSLLGYLTAIFPSRSFELFVNDFITGYRYDNPEAGTTGGDRQEYYFLNGTTLLYVVTDLFDENDGASNFETFIESLRFD